MRSGQDSRESRKIFQGEEKVRSKRGRGGGTGSGSVNRWRAAKFFAPFLVIAAAAASGLILSGVPYLMKNTFFVRRVSKPTADSATAAASCVTN